MIQEIIKVKATDGVSLDGFINKCEAGTKKVLIQIHGMTGNCYKNREKVICQKLINMNIDSICFNNRGSEVVKFIKDQNGEKRLAGSAYEEISESYYDVCGMIQFALDRGYEEIYIQGHSLGCTKAVYVYNRLLQEKSPYVKNIKALILLSLVDLPKVIEKIGKDKIPYAKQLIEEGKEDTIINEKGFSYPLSAKTILRYINGKDIDFARFGCEEDDFEVLNSFEIPLFFRWGNVDEILSMEVNEQVDFVKRKIHNNNLDVGFIDGANHSYLNKEEQLANEVAAFLVKNC